MEDQLTLEFTTTKRRGGRPSGCPQGYQKTPYGYKVTCERCPAIYEIRRIRLDRTEKRLCVKCRSEVGASHAHDSYITPESTKAERIRANGLVNMRIRRKKLKRPENCQKCSAAKRLDFHHPDYERPHEGYFICRSCHGKAHHDSSYLDGVTLMCVVDGEIMPAPPRVEHPPLKPLDADGVHELVQGFYRTKGRPVPADYYAHTGREAPGGRRQT